ncbi:Helicase associated domain HA2 containing protein [Theileria equi strain WA]|uniref:RNA helicase n=1 Tax=Theileria equi strain WA TaxID=1537102 RepID=L0AV76_THEEQ|nr:Helicase associated domain HA2 containing protein [Theileria equi strain WA]AFZ79153.1 Helicase associated domain HA2 containing protein [Theileria equi strain WA]|eukprot:XP_004828819.1 Helicase associated domain HA2 containing protein [Theileria equi strain WA]
MSFVLPVEQVREQILEKIRKHQVTVISGETGSGKSTIIPRIVYEKYLNERGNVVITQPRRVAAISLCKYVSQLMNTKVGDVVGFKVRFFNKTSQNTRIKFVTDGILIREAIEDPLFTSYSVLIIDEVHERSIRSDVLLGIIKLCLEKREDLKVIVMSATLECNNFQDFFPNSGYIHVPGRQYPVDIFYMPKAYEDYIEAAMIAVLQINLTSNNGDVLVFLPGQDDIEVLEKLLKEKCDILDKSLKDYSKNNKVENAETLRKRANIKIGEMTYDMNKWKDLNILPLYAALSIDKQSLVFNETPKKCRKVVLATNIAETSLTIPGIRYVVDTGLAKERKFLTKSNFEALTINVISKASAKQRAGRAGREGPGKIYRLYTFDSFNKMKEFSTPEIQSVDISNVYLELKMIGIKNPIEFPFVDPPSKNSFLSAAMSLYRLGAITSNGVLTDTGKLMGKIPLLPIHSKLLLTSIEFECVSEILTIVSMLSTEITFFENEKYNPGASKMRRSISHIHGDHLTLLNFYNLWDNAPSKDNICGQFGFNNNAFLRASDIRKQLASVMMSNPINLVNITKCKDSTQWDNVRMCIAKSMWMNSAKLSVDSKSYTTMVRNIQYSHSKQVNNQTVHIHPSSVLFNRQPLPGFIVYNECTSTKKVYIHNAIEISNEWLITYLPKWFKRNE